MTMTTIRVLLMVDCPSCGGTLRMNGVVPGTTCPKCRRTADFPAAKWRTLLATAVDDGPELVPGEWLAMTAPGGGSLSVGRTDVACRACEATIPLDAVRGAIAAGGLACSCGARIGIRPVPAEWAAALPGASHLVGEDQAFVASAGAPAAEPAKAIVVHCPACGGSLPVDGSRRSVSCPFCRADVVLPQVIWDRLHPEGEKEDPVFFLLCDPAARPAGVARGAFRWRGIEDAAVDKSGNLYLIAMCADWHQAPKHDYNFVVALDRSCGTRWIRHGLALVDDSRLSVSPDGGSLVVWDRRRHPATILSSADGSDRGRIGGPQASGADRHFLDLAGCNSLAWDADGTFLFLKESRLVRCAPDGTGIATWPPAKGLFGPKAEKLRPFRGTSPESAPSVDDVRDRPREVWDNAHLSVGWDGSLYLQGSDSVARFDRSGKRLYVAKLPRANDHGARGDARGFAYLVRNLARDAYAIYRVSPDGKEVRLLVDGRRPETPLREDRWLAVAPDGTLTVLGTYGVMRTFSPEGALLSRSAAAAENDEMYARRRAEMIERGEDPD